MSMCKRSFSYALQPVAYFWPNCQRVMPCSLDGAASKMVSSPPSHGGKWFSAQIKVRPRLANVKTAMSSPCKAPHWETQGPVATGMCLLGVGANIAFAGAQAGSRGTRTTRVLESSSEIRLRCAISFSDLSLNKVLEVERRVPRAIFLSNMCKPAIPALAL